MRAIVLSVLMLGGLAACGNTAPPLDLYGVSSNGPDPSTVTPFKPLAIPPDRNLPQPTPGGTNRADLDS